ncbi:MAG: hypothetical protein KatS3mg121_0433 [Gammaproteobacteria bacterium]|nr:MAG: hypothetical protein KatS3mg121_0433 [Gammaproteobacteria bacterium]
MPRREREEGIPTLTEVDAEPPAASPAGDTRAAAGDPPISADQRRALEKMIYTALHRRLLTLSRELAEAILEQLEKKPKNPGD